MSVAYRFGRHTLHPATRTLETDGKPVLLGARAYDVLLALVERRERVVPKSELLDVVWPHLVVEENNLQVQVSTLRKALGAAAIATIPGRGYQFTLPIDAEPTAAAASRQEEALPPAAPREDEAGASGLFGRDDDLRNLRALLLTHSIVCVTGPGGVGKTVLARALSAIPSPADRETVWVELASVKDPSDVVPALAAALGLRLSGANPQAALVSAISQRRLLIVLDNAEHLVASVARLTADVHAALPDVRWVVTSQLPLGIRDEHVYRLEPLAYPEAAPSERSASEYGAVALFVARATGADRRFALTDENAETVSAICRQLDGLPLAIELAAARVRELGVTVLSQSLAKRFRMLTSRARTVPPRQQSLLATLEWSHALLDRDEQKLFRRLAVFANGFTLRLALAVVGDEVDEWATIDRLAALAERSLVSVSADEPPRYRLPETMRAYAFEQLEAAGEGQEIRRRHARAVLAFYSASRLEGRTIAESNDVQRELDNARDAVQWARPNDPALAIELATLAARFTVFGPRRTEAFSWLAACEELVTDAVPSGIRAAWWTEFARFRLFNRHPDGPLAARRALALYRLERDDRGIAQALAALVRSLHEQSDELRSALGELDSLSTRHPEWTAGMKCLVAGTHAHAANLTDDLAKAMRFRKEEAAFAGAMGNVHLQNAAETNLIALLRAAEQYDEVRNRAQTLLARLRGGSETANIAYACLHLLDALIAVGRLDEARGCALEAWHACRQLNLPLAADPTTLLVARQGRIRTAAKLFGYTKAKYTRLQFHMVDANRLDFQRVEALLRAAIEPDEIPLLEAQGAEWSDDQAFRAAFEAGEA